jgi:hypothetical protein
LKKVVIALASIALVAAPASAQLVPLLAPVPVTDVQAEPVWLKELVQDVAMAGSLHQAVEIAIQNVTPTEARWALNTTNPAAIAPILETSVAELNAYNAQIEKNTGAPPPPNEALQVAEAGMANLPADEQDLTNAQNASDSCEGDLCAQQAQHRFSQLSVTQQIEQKQFDESKYIQEKKDEAEALSWMTTPNVVTTAMEAQ